MGEKLLMLRRHTLTVRRRDDWKLTARERTKQATREGRAEDALKGLEWSFNQSGVLYYCGQTKFWFETQPKEWGLPIISGDFGDFDADGKAADRPCTAYIHKQTIAQR